MLSRLSAVALGFLIVPSMASGQTPDRGPRLGGVVSGAFGNGGPAPTVSVVGAGYRFTPRFGVEVDASYMGGLDFGEFPVCAPDVLCAAQTLPALTVIGGTLSLSGRAALALGERGLGGAGACPVAPALYRRRRRRRGGPGRERRLRLRAGALHGDVHGPAADGMGGGVDFLLWRKVSPSGSISGIGEFFEEKQFFRPDMDQNLTVGRLGTSTLQILNGSYLFHPSASIMMPNRSVFAR